ncbi:MAG: response regulator transcription factor [Vampirovibrio sp.]|nr:response regulator transcription factor [Vampirovibrio sp.]
MTMHSVLLLDHQPESLLKTLVYLDFQVDICRDLPSLKEYLDLLKQGELRQYNIIILNLDFPGVNALEILSQIRNSEIPSSTPLITVSETENHYYKVAGLRRGADATLAKPIEPALLLAHFEALNRRSAWRLEHQLDEVPQNQGQNHAHERTSSFLPTSLTKRESQILEVLARGGSNRDIADNFSISETTVKNHVSKILKKLNLNNRTEAAYLFHQHMS